MQNLAYCSQKLVALWAFSCALAFSPSVNGQNAQNAVPAPCPTPATTGSTGQSNSVLAAEKQNLQNAGKQLGALFKKKPASTAAAPANPCPAPSANANPPVPSDQVSRVSEADSTPSGATQPATASPASEDTSAALAGGSSQVWSPPSADGSKAAAPTNSASPVDLSRFPDISGLRLGMPLAEATAVMKKLYPRGVGQMNVGPFGPQHVSTVGVLRAQGEGRDFAAVDLTGPPNTPIVWMISRNVIQPNVAHDVLVAGLRKKFGKETYASGPGSRPVSEDSQIQKMWWVYDEQNHLLSRATMIGGTPFGCGSHYSTDGSSHTYLDFAAGRDEGLPTYCTSSYVGVEATFSTDPILTDLYLNIVDLPLMVRYAKASGAWAQILNDKAHQQELERSNQAKPTL